MGCRLQPRGGRKPGCGGRRSDYGSARARAGWLVATFRSYERQRASRPGPPNLGQAGPDQATGHLRGEEARTDGGNQARGSAARRGLSSRGSAGSRPSPRCASSSDSTLKGSGPGPAPSPPHVRSPEGFMTSGAGAMRGPAGAEPGGATCSSAPRDCPGLGDPALRAL